MLLRSLSVYVFTNKMRSRIIATRLKGELLSDVLRTTQTSVENHVKKEKNRSRLCYVFFLYIKTFYIYMYVYFECFGW